MGRAAEEGARRAAVRRERSPGRRPKRAAGAQGPGQPRTRRGKASSPTSQRRYERDRVRHACAWSSRSSWSSVPCQACGGRRLKPESLAVTMHGKNIGEVVEYAVDRGAARSSRAFRCAATASPGSTPEIAGPILKEVRERLRFLVDVGLDYLTLRPGGRVAVRRRGAAHPAGDADRLAARRRAVHPRRAVDRTAPARQRAAARARSSSCATSATR